MPGSDDLLISGFAASAERHPDRPALDVDGAVWTYAELGARAGALGLALRQSEPSPFVGVLASRSVAAYAGVLGALAAGKGYVPLGPSYPVGRTLNVVERSGLRSLVVGAEGLGVLDGLLDAVPDALLVVCPDLEDFNELRQRHVRHRFAGAADLPADGSLVPADAGPDDPAYLIFTSGSTGQPKGVPIRNRSASDYARYLAERYRVSERDRASNFSELTFDFSVHDLFVCWQGGACLCVVPRSSLMAPAKFIREQALTMWASVPSAAAFLARMRMLRPGAFPHLRVSMFCGEPLPAGLAEQWQRACPDGIVENVYGPTEATVAITHYRWDSDASPAESRRGVVPIGRPFEGQHACAVGEDGREVPDGETGELCLAGSQLTPGYWRDPERNAEQFVEVAGHGARRWYRTGDLAQRDAGGCWHYVGRADSQVKVRGYRVELQEVEGAVREATGTDDVACLAWPVRDGSADGIVAFVVAGELDAEAALEQCRETLPPYMVPRTLHRLDHFPMSPNGKVDRAALALLLDT